jgi:hypothetical protein
VGQVVANPRRQELAQSHGPEFRVPAYPIEVGILQIEIGQLFQVTPAKILELLQKPTEGLPLTLLELGESIEGLERNVRRSFQNLFGTRDPVGLFTMDQVADDIERTPRFGSLVGKNPGLRKVIE